MTTEQFTTLFTMWFLFPVWVAMGFGDYVCHRRSKIEKTSGPIEAALHLAMLTEIGIPILLALFCEVNSLVLEIMAVAFVAHTATTIYDVYYASSRRRVSLVETVIHDFLMVIPFIGVSIMTFLHPSQFLAIFGLTEAAPNYSLLLKVHPLPRLYLIGAIAISVFGLGLPYLEELLRCLLIQQFEKRRSYENAT